MIYLVYSVYDDKAKAYLPPFFLPTEGMAKRTFADAVNDHNHQFGRHPEDYTLFYLGKFDDSNAEFSTETPKGRGVGLEYIERKKDETQLDLVSHIQQQ